MCNSKVCSVYLLLTGRFPYVPQSLARHSSTKADTRSLQIQKYTPTSYFRFGFFPQAHPDIYDSVTTRTGCRVVFYAKRKNHRSPINDPAFLLIRIGSYRSGCMTSRYQYFLWPKLNSEFLWCQRGYFVHPIFKLYWRLLHSKVLLASLQPAGSWIFSFFHLFCLTHSFPWVV